MNYLHTQFIIQELIQRSLATAGALVEHIRRGSAAEVLNSTGLAAGATAGKVDSGGGARRALASAKVFAQVFFF